MTPSAITLRPGGQDYIFVVDQGSCPATITAKSLDPSKVTVCAFDMVAMSGALLPGCNGSMVTVPDRIDQAFLVTASAAITAPVSTVIEICWVGSTAPAPPCNENNCSPYVPHPVMITVDPDAKTTGATIAAGIARDPVNTASGELILPLAPDLDLGGPFRLVFRRIYASRLAADGNVAGSLGPNWLSNFDWRLSSTGNNVEITDDAGRVIRFEKGPFDTLWKLAPYQDLSYQLVASGPSFLLGDPRTGRTYTFDANGRLASVADGKGNVHTLTYGGSGLAQVSDGLGRTLSFTYGAGSLLTSVSDGTRTVLFGYTAGLLTSFVNALGKSTVYAYDPVQPGAALLVSETLPNGNACYVQGFDSSGRVASQTDAAGNPYTFAYAPATGVTSIIDPLLASREHTHSAKARLSEFEDEASLTATLAYDSQGRRTSVTDRLGKTTTLAYHAPSGRVASITESNGAKTTLGYTSRAVGGLTFFDLASIVRSDSRSESFAYDASGNLLTWTDPAGNAWAYTYDGNGQVLTSTNPAGGVTTFTYNADGTLASVLDDAGNLTVIGYDSLRRPNLVTNPDATTRATTYDALDRVLTSEDELGRTTTFGYDDNGNLTSITNPLAQTWSFGYDAMDRLAMVTDPLGASAAATFDELGRTRSVTDANGNTLTFDYDARGRLVSVTDELGNVWSETFDAEGIPLTRTNPLGKTSSFTSDALGRITQATSPLGSVQRFTYDALGRLTSVRDPLGQTTSTSYGPLGLPSAVTLPVAGATSLFTRNPLGQMLLASGPGGITRQFGYDAQGRRTSATDALGNQVAYQYDSRNRISNVVFPGGLGSLDVTYDSAGRPLRQLFSDGTDLQYVYDDAGRLTSTTAATFAYDAADRMTLSNGIMVTRDPGGRIASLTLAPGKSITYAYDERDLLSSVTDWVGGSTTFTYDAASRPITMTRPSGLVTTWSYDDDDRLTLIQEGALSSTALTRNSKGNIASATRNVPLTAQPSLGKRTFAFNAGGQVSTFTYDALGRLLDDGVRTCVWDLASRLESYTEAGSTIDFAHDAAGMLVSRTEAATTRSFVWNYALGLPSISIVAEGGADLRYFVHTPAGLLLYSIEASDGARHFFHFDELGSTLFLTDDAGAITDSYVYTPYGEVLAASGAFDNPFTWLGALGVMREGASGLYWMRSRVYDAVTSRFLSRDPIETLDPRGANPYAYAHGNPLRYVDPRGTKPRIAGDVTAPQVAIEARLLSVNNSFLRDVGIDLLGLDTDSDDPELPPGTLVLTPARLRLLIQSLERHKTSESLSSPRLLAFGGSAANLGVSARLGIAPDHDVAASQGAGVSDQALGLNPSGIELELRPRISYDLKHITLSIVPSVPSLTSVEPVFSPRAPENAREVIQKFIDRWHAIKLLSAILDGPTFGLPPDHALISPSGAPYLADGNTAVIGGLVDHVSGQSSIPVLGDVPILGSIFRRKESSSDRKELLIQITPRVTRD